MPFTDVIDNYANGATGTLTTSDGGTVGYTVTGNANTISRPGTDLGAQVNGDGTQTVEVAFDAPVHGMTISVNRSNLGEEYFIEIDGVLIDLNDAIADGTVEFTQGGAATHEITASGGITSASDPFNGSLGFLHFQSPVSTVRIFGSGADSGNWDLFEIGIDSTDFRVVCFAADTRIQTPTGDRAVSDIQAGDPVITLDGNIRTVVQTSQRRISPVELARETRLLPVRIAAGALGNGLPTQDLRVSRQHRILLASRIAHRITGHTEVLIPAVRLVGLPGITFDRSLIPLTYCHILLDRHDILVANDAPAESLFLGQMSRQAQDAPAENEPSQDGNNASEGLDFADMPPARPFPTAQDAKKIVAAHLKHGRPLLEARSGMSQETRAAVASPDMALPNSLV